MDHSSFLQTATWLFAPKQYHIKKDKVILQTEPNTDFWQRTYYGFRHNNAPCLVMESNDNFSFTVKARFAYSTLFDQCGIVIYLDQDNWFKASIEYETAGPAKLGSVVTHYGYSDWATVDIDLPENIWYRLSRRGPDFLVEYSFDGKRFIQLRIFHLHPLGETTAGMGTANPPLPTEHKVKFGLYACSPLASSFQAEFSDFHLEPSTWAAYGT